MIKFYQNGLKIGMFLLMYCLLNACHQNETPSKEVEASTSNLSQDSISTECSKQPQVTLKAENIKTIQLENQEVTKSGIIQANKMMGYQFEGKANQELEYETNDNLCVWIFTPENKILQQPKLPLDGSYIMQISTPIGSRSFDLTLNLKQKDQLSLQPKTENPVERKISPAQAVIKHYQQLNNRNYEQTWTKLSPDFKRNKLSNRFSTYTDWWNKVRNIEIGEVELIKEFEETAVVDAQLTYVMQNGQQYKDNKSHIILVLDSQENAWLIEDKLTPSQSQY